MREDKKRAVQTALESISTAQTSTARCRIDNYITDAPTLSISEPYKTISGLLGIGEENAVHLSKLTKATNISCRELRRYIEKMRRNGMVIISNSSGYFKPNTKEEVLQYIHQETSRANSIYISLGSAISYCQNMEVV